MFRAYAIYYSHLGEDMQLVMEKLEGSSEDSLETIYEECQEYIKRQNSGVAGDCWQPVQGGDRGVFLVHIGQRKIIFDSHSVPRTVFVIIEKSELLSTLMVRTEESVKVENWTAHFFGMRPFQEPIPDKLTSKLVNFFVTSMEEVRNG